MEIRWRLRMAAAQREVWTGAQLKRLLSDRAGLELSSASISALLTKQPSQIKLSTLAALCTALQCQPRLRPSARRWQLERMSDCCLPFLRNRWSPVSGKAVPQL